MRNRYQMPGASALFGALGGQTAEQAKNAELDRLGRLDLQRSQMGLYDARAEAERADVQRKQAEFDAQQKARNLRMDPNFLAQVVGMRVPEVAPTDVNAIVKRGMGGPFELPQIDPMNRRLIGETLAGLFAGGAADAPTNAEQMAKVVSGAGSSAQRLQAPSIAASDPITAAFMLNAGTGHQAPAQAAALPGGLGTFSPLTGALAYDPQMKQSALATASATAGKNSYDAERGGIVDWTNGQFRPLTTPDGAPIGPKPTAAAAGPKPTYDATRGVVVNPADGTARPVTMEGGAPLPDKVLSPADKARQEKQRREAVAARTSMEGATADLQRLKKIAAEVRDHPGLKGITGVRGVFPNYPGGDAANAEAKLETLKSQVGFSVLQKMRDLSKTGGALGQVSDRENVMLQNNLAALAKAQSFEEFQKSLNEIIAFVDDTVARLEGAYRDTYSGVDGQQEPAAGAARAVRRTGTAPDGRKVIEYTDGSIEYAQ